MAAAREKAAGWSKQYKDGARDLRQHFAKIEADRLQAIEDQRLQTEREKRAAALALEQVELDRQRRLTIKQVFERWVASELAPHMGGDGKRIGRKDGGQYVRDQFTRRVFLALGDVAAMDIRKSDILAILDAVKAAGKLRTANMLLADLKQMFRFCVFR